MSDRPVASPGDQQPEDNDVRLFLDPTGPNFWCSVPLDTPDGRALVYAAREGEAESAGKWIGQTIRVSNLLLHPVRITKQDGEVVDLIRAVMICQSGQMVATCSSGIVSSLRTACQIYGRPPWNPPLAFTIRQLDLRDGRRMYKLMPETLEVSGKKGSK